jgi:two-component system chemotaxis sensor kinase CheA
VVVRHGNREAGLVVDSLLGEFQAVIKPLGKIFEHMSGISGATILGNGDVALILDVPALVQRYSARFDQEARQNTVSVTQRRQPQTIAA